MQRPHADTFRNALHKRFAVVEKLGRKFIDIEVGDLHRDVGGYPGHSHAMPNCCSVLRQEMHEGDEVLSEPPKGKGASLKIRFRIPRPVK
jgi:5-methylcytosine-specific restriction protein A